MTATRFHAGFLLGLFFGLEDGGDMFLRNVGCACYLLLRWFLLDIFFDSEDEGDMFLLTVG
jgi:hypothetical protein